MSLPKLTYFFDALCGWCYGFTPTLTKISQVYKGKVEFDVVSCALFLNDWEGTLKENGPLIQLDYEDDEHGQQSFQVGLIKPAGKVNDVAPHILAGGYRTVEVATGVKFGEALIEKAERNDLTLDSLYPAMAIRIVKEEHPGKMVEAAHSMMSAIWIEGLDPVDLPSYADYAAKMGIDGDEFVRKMRDPEYASKAMDDFKYYRAKPVHGFPSLLLEKDGKETIVVNGFGSRSLSTNIAPVDRFPTAKNTDEIVARLGALLDG